MSRKKSEKPYAIYGAYDSETTNILQDGEYSAFPILHQLGILDCAIQDVNASNVERHCNIELFRNTLDLYCRLDDICEMEFEFIPVICCHNLSFDMYGLASWLNQRQESGTVKVLAKSPQKPISFTIMDSEDKTRLVIWDTLVFAQQSLDSMGRDCGYMKAVGKWDYSKIRTPKTPLTDDEIEYAKKDIYSLLAWIGWWLERNPDIEPERLALNVVTKTGVVRERKRNRFSNLKGSGRPYTVGQYWLYNNKTQMPKSDDELFTMTACTRGGFTFCASESASVPYDLVDSGYIVAGYDATSQHPAQMVSHMYPVDFRETSNEALTIAFSIIRNTPIKRILDKWENPFHFAFNAKFRFENLRPKKGSIWQQCGIYPLASARIKMPVIMGEDESMNRHLFDVYRFEHGYTDIAMNAKCQFGKIVKADCAELYLTELAAWEVCQCYDFDSVEAIGGYYTSRFAKPTDMSIVSVMQFYKAKNEFKMAKEHFYEHGTIANGSELLQLGIPETVVEMMEDGSLSDTEVDMMYLRLKADLNALFGIEACNEYRCDTFLTDAGIEYDDTQGLQNAPNNPKAWYQFGQRIVGWSRIAQIVTAELAAPHVITIVNGDTDSLKFLMESAELENVSREISKLGIAIDKAKEKVCERVRNTFPDLYDPLIKIGWYVHEFSTERFCASWNKAYALHDIDKRTGKRSFAFTLAGIPARRGANEFADKLLEDKGWSFAEVCNLMLGYNVTYSNDIILLNSRSFPEWGSMFAGRVTDADGKECMVIEPRSLALYPMTKTLNDTRSKQNLANMEIAQHNNPDVNTEPCVLHWGKERNPKIFRVGDILG